MQQINTRNMKITEIVIAPSKSKDTISCDTTSSAIKGGSAQDIVPHNIVPENKKADEVDIIPEMVDGKILEQPDHSALAEGISQILRRSPQKGLKKGFRCTGGPRKGRIVAKPSTCFARLNVSKGAKIRKKRMAKAKIAGKKMAISKRSRPVARRLKTVQLKRNKSPGGKITSRKGSITSGGGKIKSKIVKPKK
jgi:hypothetical protein